jgi:ABC-type spermidine/putrescine transport system permease subunit II
MIRWILFVFLVLYIVVPLLMPIIFSFSVFWQDILPQGFTLRWYEAILTRPANYEALLVSLTVASGAVLLNLLITVPAAYALNRAGPGWGQRLREGAVILPLLFPPLVVGTALLQAFTRPPLALTGTIWMVIIAHAILGFPFMFRIVLAAFQTIDERTLSEAAASLGATFWQRMRYVLIPNPPSASLPANPERYANRLGDHGFSDLRFLPVLCADDLPGRAHAAHARFMNFP